MDPLPLLEAHGVGKTFEAGGQKVTVLTGIDLTVTPGEFLAITGTSGSGKSTLLSLLAGLDSPTEGRVIFDGIALDSLTEAGRAKVRREKIGFVFQAFHLVPSLTVLENVLLPRAFATGAFADETPAKNFLEKVGLGHRLGFFPEQLSGGEKQRVAIARALINDPKIIFADEPTGNLDRATGERVLELLRETVTRTNKTLVLVTHDAHLADLAHRTVTLKDGRLDLP